jgi:hypothetical protein
MNYFLEFAQPINLVDLPIHGSLLPVDAVQGLNRSVEASTLNHQAGRTGKIILF